MFKKVRFDGHYVYTADERKEFLGKIVSGNNQFIKIESSNGEHIYAYFGIIDSQGNFHATCTNNACKNNCIGVPPYGLFCRFNTYSMSIASYCVKA